jgi:hypothetical protein
MSARPPAPYRRIVVMVFIEGDGTSLDLLSAARRTGCTPGSLVLLAGRGEITADRAADGSLWFDRGELDARFGVHDVQIGLDAPFW